MLLFSFALLLAQPYIVDAPEGNHRVTVVLGDDAEAAETSVRAEVRRLYLDKVRTGPGDALTRSFIVNVRLPDVSGTSESVRLKDREKTTEAENWDGKLTLRWDGKVRSIHVEPAPDVPTLFLAGDSTVADQAGDAYGSWGQYLPALFGPDIAVASHAESGESARSFLGERRWAKLMSVVRRGDFLLIQFGHNDEKAATIESFKADLTRFVTEAKAKGVTPILVTPMQRRQLNSLGEFPEAVRQVAKEQSVGLVDLNQLSIPVAADVANFAPNDETHHSPAGAMRLALMVAESIRSQNLPVAKYLKKRVLLIGDSTVKNGQGNGSNGQWGWGEPLAGMVGDCCQIINRALGGRSTKTFITGGQWAEAQAMIQPGDAVLIQFGHNDASPVNDKSRARGTVRGVGEEVEEIDNELTGKHEVVHTFGWYLRYFIAGIREKGGKPVLVTPIPGNSFKDGKVSRRPHSEWTRQVAAAERVPLIDLEKLVGEKYEQMGEAAVQPMFHGDHTHTSWAGAVLNARFVAAALATILPALAQTATTAPPKSWVDPDTWHRVVRLTDEPGSASLYFNQNGYTPNGKRLVYTTPGGISALDLATMQTKEVVKGRVRLIDAGRKNERVYYIKEAAVWYTDIDTLESKRVAALPPRGNVATINADETLVAGTYVEGEGQAPYAPPANASAASAQGHPLEQPLSKGQMMERRWAARLPMGLFTMNLKTGEVKTIHKANDWLNHLLFSPTDPGLLMFCHEGPWHKVDRIWTIRTDGTQLTKIHTRTMSMEIFGHEFWSADGKTIWYDLQTPRGEDFWVAGYDLETKKRTWYHLARNEWSIHFNVSRDGKLFCGDGGDPGQVAKATDGQWIYLFRPEMIESRGIEDEKFIHAGVFRAEKLVRMAKHNYRLEPNVSFTPDRKWVVFRSNMLGPTYVFAVEVEKAK